MNNCKTSIITLILLFICSHTFSQNYNWITPNKNYLKLHINDDGIYRVTRNEFTQSGINTSNIDPRTVKVFCLGAEIPIHFFGEQDGSFDANDYLDFYGRRNYGGLTSTYQASYGPTTLDYTTDEYYNLYSDTSVYWIGWDGTNGIRYSISTFNVQNVYEDSYSFEKIHFERDSVYSLGITLNALSDYRYFNNEKITGEGWFWRNLGPQNGYTISQNFSIPLLSSQPVNCTLRVFAIPNSIDSTFNEHKLALQVNQTTISTLAKDDYTRFDTSLTFSSSLLNQSGSNTITATYQPTFGNVSATPSLYFDLLEISYPKIFRFQNNVCTIKLQGNDTTSALFKVTGYVQGNPTSIYDTRNNIKITNISSDADTLFFTGRKNGEFEVINRDITERPFRIQARQVPNLASNTNGADYIVVYNRLFDSQAEQLRSHRQVHDNLRSVKASIDDITDIFNFGMEDPIALRRFMKHVYDNWQLPKVGYVCLMGRGSLDPKNNRQTSSFYRNFIPVYGNPPTDGYFVNFNFGGFTYFHKAAIGRLPVYTTQEAQDVVDKILAYDNGSQQPQSWWKNFVMITGGPNRFEQIQYQTQSNQFINEYVAPPPITGVSSRIYRNDSAGYITFNYADSIKREINRGGLFVNFIGHAGSQDWELGLEDPSTLANINKYPLVLSMTCFTGKNSEANSRGFGEKFVNTPGRGAIGFLGSTGWSFSGAGNEINKYIFKGFANDTIRRTGALIKYANNILAADSGSFQVRNMINCYDLLGDPASKLLLPTTPEFLIGQTDYRITNHYPLVGEQVTWTIFPKNYGLYAANCLIRFEIIRNGSTYRFKDTLLQNFGYLDTTSYTFSIDTIGNYSLKATLDYDNHYPQEIPTNNILMIPLPLRNISYTPLKPIDNSVITSDSVEFTGLNPQVDLRTNSVKIILQLDTSGTFISPLFNYSAANITGVSTKVKYRIPFLDSNVLYYWRTNAIINNDSAGWSEINRFVYNPAVSYSSSRSFNSSNRSSRVNNDSIVTLYPKLRGQFKPSEIDGLYYTGSGFKLTEYSGQLQIKSYGSNAQEASYFIINNFTHYADGGENTGLSVVKVRKLTGSVLEFRNFRMSTPSSSDSVLNFLNTFDTTQYVMIGMAAYVSISDSLRQTAKNKIKQFGAQLIDSVTRFDIFDSYAFIGYIGAAPPNISEGFHRYSSNGVWTPSFANASPVFLNTAGSIEFSVGPAHRWKYFSWDRILPGGSSVNFDVNGITAEGTSVGLYSNLNTSTFTNLDTLSTYTYPKLSMFALLEIDTLSGLVSPEFNSMYFKYTPPAEIIPDNYSFIKSDSIVNEGEQVTISVKNYNIGFVPAGIVVYKWTANGPSGLVTLKQDTIYTPLQPDSSYTSAVTFNTAGLKDPQLTIDTLDINFETGMLNFQNDYYPFNNFAFTSIIIVGDTTGPRIEALFDGVKISDGDLIPRKPEISFKFFDDGKLDYSIEDTSGIFIKLDSRRIYYNIGGQLNPEISFTAVNDLSLKTLVIFKPDLSEGDHMIQFIGTDKDGHRDTLPNNFKVSYDFVVRDLYNYPNPMTTNTYFTFNLFAPERPEACRIKIYTVAGRLIKEISSPANVGFNQIFWDGLDSDGESMANGIYLYKLILEGSGKTESSIQKLAILR
ncbi:MAG: T9SS type A sorting domain-containing protein [Ignavibacteria bacterium]|nr:T9SS type A sorting domain-containing protein [Ignavibacteria bacterium]